MDRERFDQVLEAYGADSARWPEAERAEALAFIAAHPEVAQEALERARAIDALLAEAKSDTFDATLLQARIIKAARGRVGAANRRAIWALAACAVFGVFAGFGAGQFAPQAQLDDSYLAYAFEAPPVGEAPPAGEEG